MLFQLSFSMFGDGHGFVGRLLRPLQIQFVLIVDSPAAHFRLGNNRMLAVAGKPAVEDLSRGVGHFRRALGLLG